MTAEGAVLASAMTANLEAVLATVLADPARAGEIPIEMIPQLMGRLEQAKAALWARLVTLPAVVPGPVVPVPDGVRLLTAREAAAIAGVPPKWLYRRAKTIPGVRRLGPRTLRFEERALYRWLKSRPA